MISGPFRIAANKLPSYIYLLRTPQHIRTRYTAPYTYIDTLIYRAYDHFHLHFLSLGFRTDSNCIYSFTNFNFSPTIHTSIILVFLIKSNHLLLCAFLFLLGEKIEKHKSIICNFDRFWSSKWKSIRNVEFFYLLFSKSLLKGMPFSSIVYHIFVRCVDSYRPFNLVWLFPAEFRCLYKIEILFCGSMSICFGSMYDETNASYVSIRFLIFFEVTNLFPMDWYDRHNYNNKLG